MHHLNIHVIDWIVIVAVLAGLSVVAWSTQRLTKSVSDFLAANRSAGRYLLTMASGMSALGAISIAAHFEQYYEAGFAGVWWGQMLAPVMLILALSGFVIYRYRETRALTMAQFFEMRYSRRFRIFAGILAVGSGILNYGIFPAVTSRFIIYFIGLPPEIDLGFMTVRTLVPVMAFMLGLALMLTLAGGQIAVMVTDYVQGQFVQITILVIFAYLIWHVGWGDLMEGLRCAPAEQSKINPFKQGDIPNFNVWFFAMLMFTQIYGYKAWQGTQAYNAAPKSPHEARMAGILGEFRVMVVFLLYTLLPVFVYAMMHLPSYSNHAEKVLASVAAIDQVQLQHQMLVPIGLSELLPPGLMGLFASVIILAAISTDDTYLHSWGSIFIQDVVMPFRSKPLSPRAHMLALRLAIVGVAVFAFSFSLLFPLNEYIWMYFMITGAIYLGGAGAVIIGGLYWKRGTVEGAWTAMITGSSLAVLGIVLRNLIWPFVLPDLRQAYPHAAWLNSLPETFPLNGMQMSFIASMAAVAAYIVVSLLSSREPVNMDRLLHRNQYAIETDESQIRNPSQSTLSAQTWHQWLWKRLGVGSEFTRGDKAIYLFKISWTSFFFIVFIVGTVLGLIYNLSDSVWITWWGIHVTLAVTIGSGATIWFLIGGIRDLLNMIAVLKSAQRDETDDGSVIEHLGQQEADNRGDVSASSSFKQPTVLPNGASTTLRGAPADYS